MTESWCYGTMSVSGQSKGHYRHRGLWEMTSAVLLLFLALTACLTEPVNCEKDDGSGVPATEVQSSEEWISTTTTHSPAVTTGTGNNTITVHIQEEEKVYGGVETHAQVTLEQTPTTEQNVTHIKPSKRKNEAYTSLPESSFSFSTLEKQDDQEQNNQTQIEQKEEDNQDFFIISAVCVVLALLLVAGVAGVLIVRRRRAKNTAGPEKDDPYLDDDDGEKVPMPMFEDDMPSVMELEMEDFEKWMIKGNDIDADSKQSHPS